MATDRTSSTDRAKQYQKTKRRNGEEKEGEGGRRGEIEVIGVGRS